MSDAQAPEDSASQRLRALAPPYQQGRPGELMERALGKMLSYETDTCREQLAELETDLADFEQQYGLSSAEFYRRFLAGQTDDSMDYVEWASLVRTADNLRAQLRSLATEG